MVPLLAAQGIALLAGLGRLRALKNRLWRQPFVA